MAVPAYFRLGVEHILSGIDHLAFVAGLVLLVGAGRRLIGAITAFTVAHSVTLAAGTLGWVHAPAATIEALIAWSILFLAFELMRKDGGAKAITARLPWIAAFAFGLLHGFGFAGALAETGLPHQEIPVALLLFNLGVEAGQLFFVGVLLALAWTWRRIARADWRGAEPVMLRKVAPYALGCYAGFLWLALPPVRSRHRPRRRRRPYRHSGPPPRSQPRPRRAAPISANCTCTPAIRSMPMP